MNFPGDYLLIKNLKMKNISYLMILCLTVLFISCKKESLQSYLVESQEKEGFSHITIPSSILELGATAISEEEKVAYESIKKINVTGLLASNASEGQYELEKEKLKGILKGSDYKTLMSFKDKGNNVTLYYTGDADAIDEIIAFGYGADLGVGIARILGDDMNPNKIMKMLSKTQLDADNVNLSQFKAIFEQVGK